MGKGRTRGPLIECLLLMPEEVFNTQSPVRLYREYPSVWQVLCSVLEYAGSWQIQRRSHNERCTENKGTVMLWQLCSACYSTVRFLRRLFQAICTGLSVVNWTISDSKCNTQAKRPNLLNTVCCVHKEGMCTCVGDRVVGDVQGDVWHEDGTELDYKEYQEWTTRPWHHPQVWWLWLSHLGSHASVVYKLTKTWIIDGADILKHTACQSDHTLNYA